MVRAVAVVEFLEVLCSPAEVRSGLIERRNTSKISKSHQPQQ